MFWDKFFITSLVGLFLSILYILFIQQTAVVEIEATTSSKTVFKIYWAEDGGQFSEQNAGKRYLNPTTDSYRFRIGNIGSIDLLRIDPSDRHLARVEIHRLTIRQQGYVPIVLDDPEDFKKLKVINGVKSLDINNDGLTVIPDGEDPKLQLVVSGVTKEPWLLKAILQLLIIFLLVICFLHYSGPWSKFEYVPFLTAFALCLAMVMAFISKQNKHPDEYVHVAAAVYYQDHWKPPVIGSEEERSSYSVYGFSRLHTGEIAYILAGKFLWIIKPLGLDKYIGCRLFNLLLFFVLFVFCLKYEIFRVFMVPLLLVPQTWYVFSYFNSDAFALFVSLIGGYQLANSKSLLHQYLFSDIQLRSLVGLLLSAMIFGCLLLIKENYYFFDLFLLIYFIWAVVFKKISVTRSIIIRIIAVVLLGTSVFAVFKGADYAVNGLSMNQKLTAIRELHADYPYKLSTPLEKKHPFRHLKERGVPLKDLVIEKKCLHKLFFSSFGQYGYGAINGSPLYYRLVSTVGIMITSIFIFLILFYGGFANRCLLFIVLVLSSSLLFATVYHAWLIDFQCQGRYLFPMLGMIAVLLHEVRHRIPLQPLHPLVWIMFMIGTYSFIFVGLTEIAKYGS